MAGRRQGESAVEGETAKAEKEAALVIQVTSARSSGATSASFHVDGVASVKPRSWAVFRVGGS